MSHLVVFLSRPLAREDEGEGLPRHPVGAGQNEGEFKNRERARQGGDDRVARYEESPKFLHLN